MVSCAEEPWKFLAAYGDTINSGLILHGGIKLGKQKTVKCRVEFHNELYFIVHNERILPRDIVPTCKKHLNAGPSRLVTYRRLDSSLVLVSDNLYHEASDYLRSRRGSLKFEGETTVELEWFCQHANLILRFIRSGYQVVIE